jgi:WD40 repeat protein
VFCFALLCLKSLGIIRRVKRHPLGFVTCANDGFVKIWSRDGECISQAYAHPAQTDTDPFVYGVCVLNEAGDVATVGEDATLRIVSVRGEVVQTIPHPAPIRDVAVFPNGDIVTATGDGIARLWTTSSARTASDEKIAMYEEFVHLSTSAKFVLFFLALMRP